MKIRFSLIVLLAVTLSGTIHGQDKFFSEYSRKDNVSYVYVSKHLFNMLPPLMGHTGIDLENLINRMNGLSIVFTADRSAGERMIADFEEDMGAGYEEILNINEPDAGIRGVFYIMERKDVISEILMKIGAMGAYTVIRIKGEFTAEDLQEFLATLSSLGMYGIGSRYDFGPYDFEEQSPVDLEGIEIEELIH